MPLKFLGSDGSVVQALCLGTSALAAFQDLRPEPATGNGFYYLVRGDGVCGPGTYGFASSGVERVPAAPCP